LSACTTGPTKPGIKSYLEANAPADLQSEIKYAEGFDIYNWEGITKVVVYHPELKEIIIGEYYLLSADLAAGFRDSANLFVTPADSLAVFSATQLNAFDRLGALDRVIGISEARYIINTHVREKLARGEVTELATSSDFFVEKTITVNPSLIFHSPYKVTESHALDITGIPLVFFFDYFETDPLGRAEWIKFTAAFIGGKSKADSIFQEIVSSYQDLMKLAANVEERPTVFSDKYFNGQWYVPGGKSYISRLFSDAGADYLWHDDQHSASFPLDYEVVYEKAYDADYWRIIGSYGDDATYEGLNEENNLYQHFKAFKEKNIIHCNAKATAYFETSPLEPQVILADLVKAFHPDLLPDYQPRYYKLLEE
jgi:iron complex transport system substrate-binding protein